MARQLHLHTHGSYWDVELHALERELSHGVGRSSVLGLGLARDVEENVFERADAEVKLRDSEAVLLLAEPAEEFRQGGVAILGNDERDA